MMTTMTAGSLQQQQQKRHGTDRGGGGVVLFHWVTIRIVIFALVALCAYGNFYVHHSFVASSSSSLSSSGNSGFRLLAAGGSSSFQVETALDEGLHHHGMEFMLATFKNKAPGAVTAGAAFQQKQPPKQLRTGNQAIQNLTSKSERKPQLEMMPKINNTVPPPPPVLLQKEESESINTYTFPKHGCLVNTIGVNPQRHRIHCHFQNLRIDKTKISAAHMGGEPLDTVMGAAEEAEFLSYQPGAFVLQTPLDLEYPTLGGPHENYWYMNNVHNAIQYNDDETSAENKCDDVWQGLTLFITRYEYVNLYHTMTDWWNTFYSLPKQAMVSNKNRMMTDRNTTNTTTTTTNAVLKKKNNKRKVNIVFLDAHPQGNLDPVWRQMFNGNVTFVRHLPFNNTCFEEARFVPAGYTSPIYPRGQDNVMLSSKQGEHAGAFVEHVLDVYNLTHVHRIPGHVVVIERVPYISHPRSKPEMTQRLLSNMRELALNLPLLFSNLNNNTNVTVQVVTLVNDTMHDQIDAIRCAHVLIANHGAGLSHLLFLDAGAHVVELNCRYGFFPELAKWRNADDNNIHHHCQLQESQEGRISPQYWEENVVSVIKQAIL